MKKLIELAKYKLEQADYNLNEERIEVIVKLATTGEVFEDYNNILENEEEAKVAAIIDYLDAAINLNASILR